MMKLLRKYLPKASPSQTSAKLDHCGETGQNSGEKGFGLTRVTVSA